MPLDTLFDSHAHLNFKAFEGDLDEAIQRCLEQKMAVVNVGSQLPTSQKAVVLAKKYPGFFAAVGIHPVHVHGDDPDDQEEEVAVGLTVAEEFLQISKLAKDDKVVAIGETGLDYFRLTGDKEAAIKMQKEYFIKHLELAKGLDKALIIHVRPGNNIDVYDEVLEILKSAQLPTGKRGVIHCFIGNMSQAQEFIKLGFAIGFTGIVTFKKKSEELQEIARALPLQNILIETDCPYLSPEPYRGQRNEPIYVERVARKIAELKNISLEQVIEQTTQNAKEIFKIK